MKISGILTVLFLGAAWIGCKIPAVADENKQMNVLFITVDDLRPNLGCFDDTRAITPHIDRLAEKWIPEQTEKFKVIVHVGTASAKYSGKLARHAEESGAFAVGCMVPLFLPPSGVNELVDFCAEVTSKAKSLPFYYYHIPSVSGVKISMVDFIQKAKKQIPNLAGIKFTDNNFMEMQQCMELDNGKWDILHGYDEILLDGLTIGVKGAVGSTYNFMAPVYYRIMEDFEKGSVNAARKKQSLSIRVVDILNRYGGAIPAGKAYMKQVNLDCGPCRLPIKNLNGMNYENFVKEMECIELI